MVKATHPTRQLRQKLAQRPAAFQRLIEALLAEKALFRGCVRRVGVRCGKPSCRCARGERHEVWRVALRLEGKGTTRSLTEKEAKSWGVPAESYRRFRDTQRRLRRLHRETMKEIGELEEALAVEWSEGERQR